MRKAASDFGVAPAPLDLPGAESQIGLRLGRRFSTWVLAIVAGASRSWQRANDEPYTLDRWLLGLAWQRPFAVTRPG